MADFTCYFYYSDTDYVFLNKLVPETSTLIGKELGKMKLVGIL